jgi:uncharacterized protein (TIGR00369 family)
MEKIFDILKELFHHDTPLNEILNTKLDMSDENVLSKVMRILEIVYNEQMPFNKYLGIEVQSISLSQIVNRIDMKKELIGNYEQNILHGGVISSVLDLTGGIIAQLNAVQKMKKYTFLELKERLSKMSTINIRIDYIKPGTGDYFIATAEAISPGNKIIATRMEFKNDKNELIAVGTGSYLVG